VKVILYPLMKGRPAFVFTICRLIRRDNGRTGTDG